jgi:restriction endonuclease S subunit
VERLYSILEIMKIKDIVRFHSETTMPIPDVVYHLYSLPSFDNNQTREELLGQDIQSNKFTVPNRCILFNKLNVRFKRIWRIDSDEDHKIASTEFLPLIIDENKVDFAYCFYLLASPAITDYLCGQNANTSGSHKRIDPTNFFNIGIKLPPLAQQYEIGKLLSSLDAKIKLNRQINQNLEAMAKQLYDYWFVQFDFPNENGKPYKSSGGKMVWNEKLKREIPKGWNVLKLGEHCSFNKRTSNGYFNHPILYLDTSNITNNTIDELQFLNPSSDIIPSRARRLVQEGDIVYSTVRPNLKHFGIIMNPDYNMVVSTGFAVITANWSAYRYFIYQFLIQAATIENLSTIAQSAVSAYPSINTSDIENLDLVVPPDSMIEKYAKTACRLYLQIDTNYKEIKSLTKQRDELLPLLMNGQVSVNSDLSDD